MPELDITIGGRVFQVACQVGEEHYLQSAAAMLDSEAQPLVARGGRMPDARILLMAGLMLADRTASVEQQLAEAKTRIQELESRPAPKAEVIEVPVEVRVDVPVIPPALLDRMAAMAAEAEAMAEALEERLGSLAEGAEV